MFHQTRFTLRISLKDVDYLCTRSRSILWYFTC